jgi:hypothetical protein
MWIVTLPKVAVSPITAGFRKYTIILVAGYIYYKPLMMP